jgi:hypothetical protein
VSGVRRVIRWAVVVVVIVVVLAAALVVWLSTLPENYF